MYRQRNSLQEDDITSLSGIKLRALFYSKALLVEKRVIFKLNSTISPDLYLFFYINFGTEFTLIWDYRIWAYSGVTGRRQT